MPPPILHLAKKMLKNQLSDKHINDNIEFYGKKYKHMSVRLLIALMANSHLFKSLEHSLPIKS